MTTMTKPNNLLSLDLQDFSYLIHLNLANLFHYPHSYSFLSNFNIFYKDLFLQDLLYNLYRNLYLLYRVVIDLGYVCYISFHWFSFDFGNFKAF